MKKINEFVKSFNFEEIKNLIKKCFNKKLEEFNLYGCINDLKENFSDKIIGIDEKINLWVNKIDDYKNFIKFKENEGVIKILEEENFQNKVIIRKLKKELEEMNLKNSITNENLENGNSGFEKLFEIILEENEFLLKKLKDKEMLFLQQKMLFMKNFDNLTEELKDLQQFFNFKGHENLLSKIKREFQKFIINNKKFMKDKDEENIKFIIIRFDKINEEFSKINSILKKDLFFKNLKKAEKNQKILNDLPFRLNFQSKNKILIDELKILSNKLFILLEEKEKEQIILGKNNIDFEKFKEFDFLFEKLKNDYEKIFLEKEKLILELEKKIISQNENKKKIILNEKKDIFIFLISIKDSLNNLKENFNIVFKNPFENLEFIKNKFEKFEDILYDSNEKFDNAFKFFEEEISSINIIQNDIFDKLKEVDLDKINLKLNQTKDILEN